MTVLLIRSNFVLYSCQEDLMSRGVLSILGIYDEHELTTQLYIFNDDAACTNLHIKVCSSNGTQNCMLISGGNMIQSYLVCVLLLVGKGQWVWSQ